MLAASAMGQGARPAASAATAKQADAYFDAKPLACSHVAIADQYSVV